MLNSKFSTLKPGTTILGYDAIPITKEGCRLLLHSLLGFTAHTHFGGTLEGEAEDGR